MTRSSLCLSALLGLFFYFTLSGNLSVFGQIRKDPTRWTVSGPKKPGKVGDVIELTIRASINEGWHMYTTDLNPDIGPIPTTLKLKASPAYAAVGAPVSEGVHEVYEEVWGAKVRQFEGAAVIRQKVKILKANPSVTLVAEYQVCSDKDGTCLPPAEAELTTTVKTLAANVSTPGIATSVATSNVPAKPAATYPASPSVAVATVQTATAPAAETLAGNVSDSNVPGIDVPTAQTATVQAATATQPESLWGFILAAFLSGLAALLTPCVFPIIPMTVSFFTNQKGGAWKALLYGASIIGIYVLIGTVVSRINGPGFANFVSTHWLPNLLFFAVFFVFGLSFLGLFEITLPSSLVNKADQASERGGLGGIFFMAFTLVLVSFSCTGPIVGSLLVASAGGAVLKPIVGMAAFSAAFAIPFTLFALFPQWLQKLPKSGGWLNSVKVVLGFLELALALKFLSIADQVYHWGLLDREVYLAFWIVIFSLLGFYLLGKIRLPHDSLPVSSGKLNLDKFTLKGALTQPVGTLGEPIGNGELAMSGTPVTGALKLSASPDDRVSIPRLLLAIGTFTFVVYMIPGMWGAPLNALAGYLPPLTSQDFTMQAAGGAGAASPQQAVRHSNLFKLPLGLTGFFQKKWANRFSSTSRATAA
jgi:thiol:disulfide interchange protein